MKQIFFIIMCLGIISCDNPEYGNFDDLKKNQKSFVAYAYPKATDLRCSKQIAYEPVSGYVCTAKNEDGVLITMICDPYPDSGCTIPWNKKN